jgi:PPOX class probable F420-dependent enzyme
MAENAPSEQSSGIDSLRRERYISFTTYRRNGQSVATPVWFAIDGQRIVLFTGDRTGKVKRLRHDTRVTLAACSFNGKVKGPAFAGTAVILPDSAKDEVMPLIRSKYRITKLLLDTSVHLIRLFRRKPQTRSVYIEVRLDS